jgi:hypothetical protein
MTDTHPLPKRSASYGTTILKVTYLSTTTYLPLSTMMIRAFQNAALFLVLVSCTKSVSASEHNDLNKVISAVILEMNNEGVFTEFWYVCCHVDV